MSDLAKLRAYWLRRLMSEQGRDAASLAREVWLGCGDKRIRAGGQLLREWMKTGTQPRDATLTAVSKALGVCPSTFHTPFPGRDEAS